MGDMTEEKLNTRSGFSQGIQAEVTFLEWTRGGFLRHAQVKDVLLK